jgi:hypothetical protein
MKTFSVIAYVAIGAFLTFFVVYQVSTLPMTNVYEGSKMTAKEIAENCHGLHVFFGILVGVLSTGSVIYIGTQSEIGEDTDIPLTTLFADIICLCVTLGTYLVICSLIYHHSWIIIPAIAYIVIHFIVGYNGMENDEPYSTFWITYSILTYVKELDRYYDNVEDVRRLIRHYSQSKY